MLLCVSRASTADSILFSDNRFDTPKIPFPQKDNGSLDEDYSRYTNSQDAIAPKMGATSLVIQTIRIFLKYSELCQYICWPPLIESVDPVMKPALSLVKNSTPRAISLAWPSRPTGI